MDKKYILQEIKRITKSNDGKPPGKRKFWNETGIKESDWYPNIWLRWGDALLDAGFMPNQLQIAYDERFLIDKIIILIRELKHFPLAGEIRRKSREDPAFPSKNTFNRFGGKQAFAKKIIDFCMANSGYNNVIEICECICKNETTASSNVKAEKQLRSIGYVYLIKSGKYYKIGKSNAPGRREYEYSIQLPEDVKTLHLIKTDDPDGIEEYWHKRFAQKRMKGEWFALTSEDINAFKRRKFM